MALGPQQKTPIRFLDVQKHTHTHTRRNRKREKEINNSVVRALIETFNDSSLFIGLPNFLEQQLPPGPTNQQPGGQWSVLLLTHALGR